MRNIKIVFIIICILSIIIPLIFTDYKGGKSNNLDNRVMAKGPVSFFKDGSELDITKWINDNIGFRTTMLGLKGYIEYNILHKSPTSKVMLGKDGFMFYTWDNNIKIAQNQYPLSDIDLRKSIKNLMLTNDILAKDNKTFVFAIAPSKADIYSEYLYVKTAEEIISPIDIFDKELKNKVNFINLKQALYKEKEKNAEMLLYYKTDTHWNQYGAYIGYKKILDEFNTIGIFDNKSEPYMQIKLVQDKRTGEFAKMMGAQYILKPEETFNTEILNSTIMGNNIPKLLVDYKQKYNPFAVYTFKNNDTNKNKNIIVIGDSMFNSSRHVPELLANHFKNYYQIWQQKFDNKTIMDIDVDIVLLEIAERYSKNIGNILTDFVKQNYKPKAVISSDDIPKVMENGKTYSFHITIENKGEYNLGYDYMTMAGVLHDYKAYKSIDQGVRFNLPENTVIKPGEKYVLKVDNFTPNFKGKYFVIKAGEIGINWISNEIKVNLK